MFIRSTTLFTICTNGNKLTTSFNICTNGTNGQTDSHANGIRACVLDMSANFVTGGNLDGKLFNRF